MQEISRRLGWAASSICRELIRNLGLRGYRPKQAHEKAQAQAKRPGPRRFANEVRADAEAWIKEGWTPEIYSRMTVFLDSTRLTRHFTLNQQAFTKTSAAPISIRDSDDLEKSH